MSIKEGYEFLESEIQIHNMLVRKQHEGDEILSLFNIQLVNEDYHNRDTALDNNNIYIVRGDTLWDKSPTTFSGEGFNTKVYIVINTHTDGIIRASALLKSAVKSIRQYIEFESIKQYTRIYKIQPRYVEPGKLVEYIIELHCFEIDELGLYSKNSKDIKFSLQINAKVTGEEEYHRIFPLQEKSELIQWDVEIPGKNEEEFAGG